MAKFRDHRDIIWPGAWLIENDIVQGMPEIPNNRVMYIQKFTDEDDPEPTFHQDCKTVEDIFDKFKPSKTVQLSDENGAPVEELLEFHSLMDFGKEGIINQSDFLRETDEKKKMYADFIDRLRSNILLRNLMADPEAKQAYLDAIAQFIQELEEMDPED